MNIDLNNFRSEVNHIATFSILPNPINTITNTNSSSCLSKMKGVCESLISIIKLNREKSLFREILSNECDYDSMNVFGGTILYKLALEVICLFI